MKKISIKIGGMGCAACSARIEKALNGLNGVESAAVNLAAETASVSYNPEMLKLSDISNVIISLGYSVIEKPENQTDSFPDFQKKKK